MRRNKIEPKKSKYEKHLLEQSDKNINFVAGVLGSMDKAIALRNGDVTLDDLGMTSPSSNPIRFSDID
jgi:hypothetical protein|tara:strand:+ start:322 stop:525 length:204 start_codon:yes stop_codon:yes gene_type:complete